MKTFLKIKGLSLAAEARIIKRLEKQRVHPKLRENMHLHRVHVLRPEARATHLALGFLRGTSLLKMELPLRPANEGHLPSLNMTRTAPDWKRVEQLVRRYGPKYFASEQEMLQRFAEWKETGGTSLKAAA